jgi:hypothetical protein
VKKPKMLFAKLKIILKISGATNPETLNPGTYISVKYTMAMVITKENSPNVANVMGKLMNFKTGFTKLFKKAITSETRSAVAKPSTSIPFK